MLQGNYQGPLRAVQPKAKVYSVGTFLPKKILTSREIFENFNSEQNYGIPSDWMDETMGIKKRHIADIGTQPSELAIPAAQEALDAMSELNRDEIDMVIFCGIERDQPEPATAHTIQDALGLNASKAFDVANACFGFFEGLEIATTYIEAKKIRYALIVTGEVPSRVLRSFAKQLKGGVSQARAMELLGGLSVGDAGGAVLIGPNYEDESGFQIFNSASNSAHVDKCYYQVKDDGEIEGRMVMAKVLAQGHKLHRKLTPETLDMLGWDKYDVVITHQTSKASEDFVKRLGVSNSDNQFNIYQNRANVTSAGMPLVFKMLMNSGKVKPGLRIGGFYAGSGVTAGQFGYLF